MGEANRRGTREERAASALPRYKKSSMCTCCYIEKDPPKYPSSPYLTGLMDSLLVGAERAISHNLCEKHERDLRMGLQALIAHGADENEIDEVLRRIDDGRLVASDGES